MKFSSLSVMASVATIFSAAPAVASERRLLRKQDSSALEDAKFWNRALAGSSTPPKCKDEETILGWVLNESGGDKAGVYDNDRNDFDILANAVLATDLIDAVAEFDGETATLPTDKAFVEFAGQLGGLVGKPFNVDDKKYDEEAAFNFIVETVTELADGKVDVALLFIADVLLYHVSEKPVFFDINSQKFPFTYKTKCDCFITATKNKKGNVFLEDSSPVTNPRVKNSQKDIELCNGQISVITEVLFFDIFGSDGRRLDDEGILSLTKSC